MRVLSERLPFEADHAPTDLACASRGSVGDIGGNTCVVHDLIAEHRNRHTFECTLALKGHDRGKSDVHQLLIPTDGSELAGKAVQHGMALAKCTGAKATVLTVTPYFHVLTIDPQMIEDTSGQYNARVKDHAQKISWSRRPGGASNRRRMRENSGRA
jgi:hypothetical protein